MDGLSCRVKLPEAWQDYKLKEFLGKGSYGRVYKLEKPDGTPCAMKVVSGAGYEKEADILAGLAGNPGIVRILDHRLEEDTPGEEKKLYILMEYLTDLPSWAQNHTLTESQIITMLKDLLDGLAVCRRKGLLHRDIKPENILVDGDGHARLADFGIARIQDRDNEHLTRRGTVGYMAPEVCQGRSYDHRADLYSLALVFYQLVNDGRLPFLDPDLQIPDSGARQEAFQKRMSGKPLPAPAKASEGLGRILRKACAYRAHDRYASPEKMKKDLVRLEREAGKRKKKNIRSSTFLWTKKRKITIAVLALLLLTAACLSCWYIQPVASGGDSVLGTSYELYRDGRLVISGEGAFDLSCLYRQKGRIRKIIVKGGVSFIGTTECAVDENQIPSMNNVREIVLEEGVRCLGYGAFKNFYALEKVTLPDSLETIGASAFENCRSLKEISLPDKIRELPNFLFSGCSRLGKIHFPARVRSIGFNAYEGTAWLHARKKESGYVMVNDILIAYQGKDEELHIPEDLGIHTIAPGAFSECDHLQYIELPDTIEIIGNEAFSDCFQLKEVKLPKDLKEIRREAFCNCRNLRKVNLPSRLQRIEEQAFQACTALDKLTIPDSLEWIGGNAFDQTPFLERQIKDGFVVVSGILLSYQGKETRVKIPPELRIHGIAGQAFNGQIHLRSLEIPEGVSWIGKNVFSGCYNLERIRFPRSLTCIKGGAMCFSETKWLEEKEKTGKAVIINDMLIEYNPYGLETDTIAISEDLPVTRIMGISDSYLSAEVIKLVIPDQIRKIDKDAIRNSDFRNDNQSWIIDVTLPAAISELEIREAFEGTPWYYIR